MNTLMARRLGSFALLGLLAACASTPKPADETKSDTGTTTTTTNTNTGTAQPSKPAMMDPLKDPNNILSKRNVYFDYDKYDIRDDQRPVTDAHGRYLASNQGRTVRIEGNADERGSREYNLALGQKRAEALRKALVVLGAQDKQLEAVSNGKEKPRATGHDEASWAENRRDDIIYSGE